jgi:mRNA-degrading endonuclease toxin of MazEF toxin-antitoxin module
MKQFLEWIGLKEKLHNQSHKPPFVSQRDMWWVSFGENVGSEMNGKSHRFTRPALISKKLAHGFYLTAPTTTQARSGSWYVKVSLAGVEEYVCLHQIRVVDYRRLYSKLGQIDTDDFDRLREAFRKLYF